MATIRRFEDIQAWQKARELVRRVKAIVATRTFARDFVLRDQLRRAALSIVLNIAEGFARRTDAEFSRFLVIARSSAAEVQAALYVALDLKYLDRTTFDELYASCEEISKMTFALGRYLLHRP